MLACSLFTTGSCAQVLHFSCFQAHPSSNKVSAKSVLLGDTHQHVSAADSMTLCGVVQTHTHKKPTLTNRLLQPCARALRLDRIYIVKHELHQQHRFSRWWWLALVR